MIYQALLTLVKTYIQKLDQMKINNKVLLWDYR